MAGGRPTLYKDEYCDQAFKMCLLGSTDKDLADFFEVEEQTVNNWKIDHPEFFESIKDGKERADSNIAKSLYQKALGYSHPEDKIFICDGDPVIVPTIKHYPPDTMAASLWLRNRKSSKWKDKTETDVNVAGEGLRIIIGKPDDVD
jgi:hypothetical protein